MDHAIVVNRNYSEVRASFLASLGNEKLVAEINKLDECPYYFPHIFPKTAGLGITSLFRKKVALLKALEPLMEEILFDGEEVRFVTNGIYSSFAEQYFLGGFATFINRTALIFTNFRVILANVNYRSEPLHMKWHLPYDQIAKFTAGGISSAMVFTLQNKTRNTFVGMPTYDLKPAQSFIYEMIERAKADAFRMPHYACCDSLCPSCFTAIPKEVYACEKCGDTFIQPKKPALMSLCLPCLGDFYMGHWAIGIVELLLYGGCWIVFMTLLLGRGTTVWPNVALFILFMHGVDAALTHHIAKKGLISISKAWQSH